MNELTPQERALAWARRNFPDSEVKLSFGNIVQVTTPDLPPWISVLVSGPSPVKR